MAETLGERMIAAGREALAVAKGKQTAASVHACDYAYHPKQGWQSMESAPRDGRRVLLRRDPDRTRSTKLIVIGEYVGVNSKWRIEDYQHIHTRKFLGWMPLPSL